MACGSCGGARKKAAAEGGRQTVYVVTWGSGAREEFKTIPAARVAMAKETDPAKRRGMSMTTKRV